MTICLQAGLRIISGRSFRSQADLFTCFLFPSKYPKLYSRHRQAGKRALCDLLATARLSWGRRWNLSFLSGVRVLSWESFLRLVSPAQGSSSLQTRAGGHNRAAGKQAATRGRRRSECEKHHFSEPPSGTQIRGRWKTVAPAVWEAKPVPFPPFLLFRSLHRHNLAFFPWRV